jgi:hypothetical protein
LLGLNSYLRYDLGRVPYRRPHILLFYPKLLGSLLYLHSSGQRAQEDSYRYPRSLYDGPEVHDPWIEDDPLISLQGNIAAIIAALLEVRAAASEAHAAGGRKLHCLAWEFEMDPRLVAEEIEASEGVRIRLLTIPREIMEKNRTDAPLFFEVAVLEAEAVYAMVGGKRRWISSSRDSCPRMVAGNFQGW